MLLAYLILSVALAAGVLLTQEERLMKAICWLFYGLQAAGAAWVVSCGIGRTALGFFTFDPTGALFHCLLALVSPVAFGYGLWYLDREDHGRRRLYNGLVMLLCVALTGVYYSNNIAVTWILLEATTLCTAGIIYHRRDRRSLEATWKYIFVCSVGITISYLGVLLFGGLSHGADLSYEGLARSAATANPLFLRLAFLFIVTGYSCKLEVFPLYTIGVDANMAAPAPASALVSTALVNGGFVSVLRVYRVMEPTDAFAWAFGVLVVAGIISVLAGAMFLRRTNHYKRFLSYSTVENMGIVLIGLGLGGFAAVAAVLHAAGHTLIKSSLFLQMSRIGKSYGHYQVSRIGGYMNVNRPGAVVFLVLTLLLLGFPPSPLFLSEVVIFREMAADGRWVLLAATVLILCSVMYNFARNILRLCYNPVRTVPQAEKPGYRLLIPVLLLVVSAAALGVWQPEWLARLFGAMDITIFN
ncbi:MAG: hydrogenase 4 subunit F [Rikenellaceae bacterium]|nr:hydrogenase 4 subunit F [Rikenellaceae bacterium]